MTMEKDCKPLEEVETDVTSHRLTTAPSVHVRALITWMVIFPLVAIGMTVTGPLIEHWNPVLRALTLTLVVVPTAVYIGVPRLLDVYNWTARVRGKSRVRNATR
ncbi:antibiotic biosynthesis monooxygenase (ABM) superfamily enzyme [Conyzicola lurida]|uniref:Antibiotic biosynthesis monooxygenase (ABM) superfamily enzyme n=2 Tax=Conyzicola lurida TaxID=1172621 RepID=A0A841APH3_9MICO|nr:antibiotic biosynthesis monooxygenase (ABM) superfamily enzyme [Conyzicola lurida]